MVIVNGFSFEETASLQLLKKYPSAEVAFRSISLPESNFPFEGLMVPPSEGVISGSQFELFNFFIFGTGNEKKC